MVFLIAENNIQFCWSLRRRLLLCFVNIFFFFYMHTRWATQKSANEKVIVKYRVNHRKIRTWNVGATDPLAQRCIHRQVQTVLRIRLDLGEITK